MEFNEKAFILAYVDDIIILGDAEIEIKSNTEKLINPDKKMSLALNEDKTKYLIMTRRARNKSHIRVGPYSFEQVGNFKYLGININCKYNMNNEIQIRISAETHAYFAMSKMLSSKMLSKATKEKIYT